MKSLLGPVSLARLANHLLNHHHHHQWSAAKKCPWGSLMTPSPAPVLPQCLIQFWTTILTGWRGYKVKGYSFQGKTCKLRPEVLDYLCYKSSFLFNTRTLITHSLYILEPLFKAKTFINRAFLIKFWPHVFNSSLQSRPGYDCPCTVFFQTLKQNFPSQAIQFFLCFVKLWHIWDIKSKYQACFLQIGWNFVLKTITNFKVCAYFKVCYYAWCPV